MNDIDLQKLARTRLLADSNFTGETILIEAELDGITPAGEDPAIYTGEDAENLQAAVDARGRALVILPFEATSQAQAHGGDGTAGLLLIHHGMILIAENPARNHAQNGAAAFRADEIADALIDVLINDGKFEVPQGIIIERPEHEMALNVRYAFFDLRETRYRSPS